MPQNQHLSPRKNIFLNEKLLSLRDSTHSPPDSRVTLPYLFVALFFFAYITFTFILKGSPFFSRKICEMYTRNQDLEEDALLDSLSILKINCTLARDCLWAGRIALERIFLHFFPKAALLDKFELLAKSFMDKGDPVLVHRQVSLKIGVEGTIALVIASGEKIDWAKVAAVRGLNKDNLIKGVKAFSKKLIAIIEHIFIF
jgi:hypothetical protein